MKSPEQFIPLTPEQLKKTNSRAENDASLISENQPWKKDGNHSDLLNEYVQHEETGQVRLSVEKEVVEKAREEMENTKIDEQEFDAVKTLTDKVLTLRQELKKSLIDNDYDESVKISKELKKEVQSEVSKLSIEELEDFYPQIKERFDFFDLDKEKGIRMIIDKSIEGLGILSEPGRKFSLSLTDKQLGNAVELSEVNDEEVVKRTSGRLAVAEFGLFNLIDDSEISKKIGEFCQEHNIRLLLQKGGAYRKRINDVSKWKEAGEDFEKKVGNIPGAVTRGSVNGNNEGNSFDYLQDNKFIINDGDDDAWTSIAPHVGEFKGLVSELREYNEENNTYKETDATLTFNIPDGSFSRQSF